MLCHSAERGARKLRGFVATPSSAVPHGALSGATVANRGPCPRTWMVLRGGLGNLGGPSWWLAVDHDGPPWWLGAGAGGGLDGGWVRGLAGAAAG